MTLERPAGAGVGIDRRSMLRGAAAISGAMAAPALHARSRPDQRFRFVVCDRRFRESTAFVRYLASRGAERLDVTDGLTALWQERLAPHWRSPRGAVAGLTTRAVWDGLSEQARGQFRKPRLTGIHDFADLPGTAHHKITLPGEPIASARAGKLVGQDWPVRMAMIMQRCALQAGPVNSCSAGNPSLAAAQQQLVSWVIV